MMLDHNSSVFGMVKTKCQNRSIANALMVGALALTAVAVASSSVASAQDVLEPVDGMVCMASTLRDSPIVPEQSRGKIFEIAVHRDSVSEMESLGFWQLPCPAAGLRSVADIEEYRDSVCEEARYGTHAIYDQFESAIGARPDMLCASAERLVGAWREPSEQ